MLKGLANYFKLFKISSITILRIADSLLISEILFVSYKTLNFVREHLKFIVKTISLALIILVLTYIVSEKLNK